MSSWDARGIELWWRAAVAAARPGRSRQFCGVAHDTQVGRRVLREPWPRRHGRATPLTRAGGRQRLPSAARCTPPSRVGAAAIQSLRHLGASACRRRPLASVTARQPRLLGVGGRVGRRARGCSAHSRRAPGPRPDRPGGCAAAVSACQRVRFRALSTHSTPRCAAASSQ